MGDIVKMVERCVDVYYVLESSWRGGSARWICVKNERYKFFWLGKESGKGGVGVLVAESG